MGNDGDNIVDRTNGHVFKVVKVKVKLGYPRGVLAVGKDGVFGVGREPTFVPRRQVQVTLWQGHFFLDQFEAVLNHGLGGRRAGGRSDSVGGPAGYIGLDGVHSYSYKVSIHVQHFGWQLMVSLITKTSQKCRRSGTLNFK